MSTNHAQSELAAPHIRAITNGTSTQLTLRADPVTNARSYEVRYTSAPGAWQPVLPFTAARRMVVPSLTPGTTYSFEVRAIGGSTGASPWSDPVSHMAT